MNQSRSREAALRQQERRKREDEAPRLAAIVPTLASLRLAIEERRATSASAESKHVRLVIVDHAPALFIVPCGDPACRGGGFDLTDAVLRELKAGKTAFTVDDACFGEVGVSHCGRLLRATATATYRGAP